MKDVKALIVAFALLLFSNACLDEPDCFGLNNNIAGITFKNIADNKSTTLTDVTVTAEGASVELVSGASTSKVNLPLNYYEDETAYTFQIGDDVYRLVLGYRARPQFVSTACGERFVLSDLHLVEHDFDSVRLVNTTPGTNSKAANIEIFW